jgi:hypothetical protein
MDLSSDEKTLKEVVHAAESLFSGAGIDYMMHNAAFERPVSIIIHFLMYFYLPKSLLASLVHHHQFLLTKDINQIAEKGGPGRN